jgi:hypothetical protein
MPVAKAPSAARQYYVLDPHVGEYVGGVKVEPSGSERVVRMSSVQAQYFVDHGTIGEKPLSELSASEQELLKQMHRSAAP